MRSLLTSRRFRPPSTVQGRFSGARLRYVESERQGALSWASSLLQALRGCGT